MGKDKKNLQFHLNLLSLFQIFKFMIFEHLFEKKNLLLLRFSKLYILGSDLYTF